MMAKDFTIIGKVLAMMGEGFAYGRERVSASWSRFSLS
jgi:hypothetical protein